MVIARKLKGFRDLDWDDMASHHKIVSTLRGQAQAAGFLEIQTPALEYADVLLGSGGEETDKEVYRFEDHGERDVALRFDLTVPFARFVAENRGRLVLPFRKFQVGTAWRGEKPQKGRYREFCQADIDIIGVDSVLADYDVLSIIGKSLQKVLPTRFTISVGHRQLLSGLIHYCFGPQSEAAEQQLLIALDKLDKIGESNVIDLLDKKGYSQSSSKKLLEWLSPELDQSTLIAKLKELWKDEEELAEQLERMQLTLLLLRQTLDEQKASVNLNLRIARGLGYYTGLVFETTIDSLPSIGSISSGGRYNKLVSRFSKQELAGVGGSVGVDRLMAALQEIPSPTPLPETHRNGVFIAIADIQGVNVACTLVNHFRDLGLRAEMTLKPSKLNQQFRYADRQRYQYVVTIGNEELAAKSYSLKDLETGQERKSLNLGELEILIDTKAGGKM